MTEAPRDHGGGLDAAIAQYGGDRADWLDLSTGINPQPYPAPELSPYAWTALPDKAAQDRLITAARAFWNVPAEAEVVAAPGASALIARLPMLAERPGAYIPTPTYNEHRAAFDAHAPGAASDDNAPSHVYVHPNNPDGRLWPAMVMGKAPLTIIDESFCDVAPDDSHIALTARPGVVVLKSFGKFWGMAGLRLGFAIGHPDTLRPAHGPSLPEMLGPWAVSGPALEIGATALEDQAWAAATRARLAQDALRLDAIMSMAGAHALGGTDLFRLFDVEDAAHWQDRLAKAHIWSRTFPYAGSWLRLGMPTPEGWAQLGQAIA